MKIEIHHHHYHENAVCELTHLLQKVLSNQEKLMHKIDEYIASATAAFDKIEGHVTGLQGDVESLTAQIAALKETITEPSPEQQAALDALATRAATISDKIEALDAVTPPVAPPATP